MFRGSCKVLIRRCIGASVARHDTAHGMPYMIRTWLGFGPFQAIVRYVALLE